MGKRDQDRLSPKRSCSVRYSLPSPAVPSSLRESSMRFLSYPFALCLLFGSSLIIIAKPDRKEEPSATTESWPEFRGPTGQGHYTGKALPIEWSTTKNVAWKTALPGEGG